MTEADKAALAEIMERRGKITPGPWNCKDEHPGQACGYVRPNADKWDEVATCYARGDFANARADADFIAHAPTDIDTLLGIIAKLEARIEQLQEKGR